MALSDEDREYLEGHQKRMTKAWNKAKKAAQRAVKESDGIPLDGSKPTIDYYVSFSEVFDHLGDCFFDPSRVWVDRAYVLEKYKFICDYFFECSNISKQKVAITIGSNLMFGWDFTDDELTETTPGFNNVQEM